MKECEIFSSLKVPCGSKIVIRIDGRNFSSLTRGLNFKKPFDEHFTKIMVNTCVDFFKEFDPYFIYTFSDEANILLDEIPFGGRIEKLDSVFASFISGSFTKNALNMLKLLKKPLSFDSRVILLSTPLIVKYFKERQDEAWRNCMNGYAYWTLRKDYDKKESVMMLENKKSAHLHDILFERGVNLAEVPLWQRRGIGIYKKDLHIEGYNPIEQKKVQSIRKKAHVDCKLPIFDEKFFKNNIRLI